MEKISQPVMKRNHEQKISGQSVYVGDYPNDGILTGKLLHSKLARAKSCWEWNFPHCQMKKSFILLEKKQSLMRNKHPIGIVLMTCSIILIMSRPSVPYFLDQS